MLSHQKSDHFDAKRYLDFLRANGFEIPDDQTFKVELDGTFNDMWWTSHVCVLRYMWEYPNFVANWQTWCDKYPEWDPWVIFVVCHLDEGEYNSNHSIMHSNMRVCPNPKETLAKLKETPTSLEGNSKGIHAAWVSADWQVHGERLPHSFEDRYQYFLQRKH